MSHVRHGMGTWEIGHLSWAAGQRRTKTGLLPLQARELIGRSRFERTELIQSNLSMANSTLSRPSPTRLLLFGLNLSVWLFTPLSTARAAQTISEAMARLRQRA
jgi:hypothetical protein